MSVDITGIEEARRVLGDKVVERAIRSTVSKLTTRAQTAAKKAIRADYNIKAKDLVKRGSSNRQGLEVRRPGFGQSEGYLLGLGGPLPLIHFGATPSTPEKDIMRRRRRGVTVKVKKATGRSRLHHVFVARTPSGHVGLFERKGKGRLPIEQKYGPGIASMLGSKVPEVRAAVEEAAPSVFAHELEHQIMKAMGRR